MDKYIKEAVYNSADENYNEIVDAGGLPFPPISDLIKDENEILKPIYERFKGTKKWEIFMEQTNLCIKTGEEMAYQVGIFSNFHYYSGTLCC